MLLTQCRNFYLYWWQHGGRGSCSGDVRLHRAANALPAAVNALPPPPPLRCPHLHRGATAKDAALPPGYRNAVKLAATATLPLPPPPPPATLTLPMPPPRCPPSPRRCCGRPIAIALPLCCPSRRRRGKKTLLLLIFTHEGHFFVWTR